VHARLGSTFQSLGIRNYRLFATGQLISLIFGWVQITAQDWLVLQLSHDSPSALGVVTAFQFAPILLLTLYAGKLADRFDKRRLLLVVNVLYLILAGLMGTLVVSGAVHLWQVFVFAVLWGTVTALETPTRQAFVSELVERRLLPNALALSAATFNSARVIGPAIGGLSIALFGTGTRVRGQRRLLRRAADRAVPDAPRRPVPRRAGRRSGGGRRREGLRRVALCPVPA